MGRGIKQIFPVLLAIIILNSCGDSAVPKPRGHFRIDFPEKQYVLFDSTCPYTFYYPEYGTIASEPGITNNCWFNIDFRNHGGKLHLSYMEVNNNLSQLIEDAHKLAYKHSVKADAIEEITWNNAEKSVYGLAYNIKGNAASTFQFYLTDSIKHYIRGALYFNTQPDKDSLAPVNQFFRKDIEYLIETLEWKK